MGYAADRVLGDPPRWHPVAGFGRVAGALERVMHADRRAAGVVHTVLLVGGTAALAAALGRAAHTPVRRAVWTAAVCWTVLGGRSLDREAAAMAAALQAGDLDGARTRLRSLCARDPATLDVEALTRATIESVAENTSDAVVAPLVWGGLAGPTGMAAHRAINTLDAMVGHRSQRYEAFGWAAARADDLANYIPARLAALAVAALTPRRAPAIWRAVREDAPAHPSPNGGVIEAAVAAALDIRLGGTNQYAGHAEHRGVLGNGPEPTTADGRRAIRLTTAAGALIASVGVLR